jgi:hypothetical protein
LKASGRGFAGLFYVASASHKKTMIVAKMARRSACDEPQYSSDLGGKWRAPMFARRC